MTRARKTHGTFGVGAALAALLLLASAACEDDPTTAADIPTGPAADTVAGEPDTAADAAPPIDVPSAPGATLPFATLYNTVRESALGFDFDAGDWTNDFGDAAYYGLAYFTAAGLRYGVESYLERADVTYARNIDVLRRASEDVGYFFEGLEESQMAALGVIEAIAAEGGSRGLTELDALIDLADAMVASMGTYLDIDLDSYALYTYGPTTITAEIALINLRYAELLDTPSTAAREAYALDVIDVVDARAWTGERYRFSPENEDLYLYPNIIMILANAMAFRITGEERYRERALETYDGIQPLKDTDKGAYRSPYSAITMGATTDDYITLSSQNFTLMALALLHGITGEDRFREEMTEITGFLETYLLSEGRLYHHWMDGRLAIPSDPEYFCSGCNLQFLHLGLYAEEHVYGE